MLVALICTGLLAADGPSASARGDDLKAYQGAAARIGRDAEAHVKLALWCERHGLEPERLKQLALAVLVDPDHPTARGLLGLVEDGGQWRRPEAVAARIRDDAGRTAALADYQARRARAPGTAEGHWALALWCVAHDLAAEAQAHFAAVIRLDPSRDAAWKRLGYQKHRGRWMTDEQIARAKAEADAQEQASRRWRPKLKRWRSWLDGKAHRTEAERLLSEVTDPRAVPAIGEVFGRGPAADQLRAVQLFGQIASPTATQALATLAVLGRSDEVRRRAAETLRRRDWREAADTLIASIRKPIRYEVRPYDAARPREPGLIYIEGKRFDYMNVYGTDDLFDGDSGALLNQMIRQETAYRQRLALQRQSRLESFVNPLSGPSSFGLGFPQVADPLTDPSGEAALLEAARLRRINALVADRMEGQASLNARMGQVVATLDRTNATIRRATTAASGALEAITGEDFGDDREAWEKWAAEAQGLGTSSTRPEPPKPRGVVINVSLYSCFAAGTPVKTLDGDRPIETLAVGDRVLTQDPGDGRLSFQPVVAALHNPPAATLRIGLGDDEVVATGIHRFWKAGAGWAMARDLKAGDPIRTLRGLERVASIRPEAVQPVFNLEVAAGRSFFVGRAGALVHDNSLVAPTPEPFDAPAQLAAAARAAGKGG